MENNQLEEQYQIVELRKAGGNNVACFFANKQWLILDINTVTQFYLGTEKVLTKEQLEEIIKRDLYIKLYNFAGKKISAKNYSSQEVEDFLKSFLYQNYEELEEKVASKDLQELVSEIIKKNSQTLREQVINKFKELDLLDDAKLAKNFIADQLRKQPQGLLSLTYKLKKRGIETNDIQNATKEFKSSPKAGKELLQQSLEKNYTRLKDRNYPLMKLKQNLTNRLLYRGFPLNEIQREIDVFLRGKYNDTD